MGREGLLADLSDVEGSDQIIPSVRATVTVNGKMDWRYRRQLMTFLIVVKS